MPHVDHFAEAERLLALAAEPTEHDSLTIVARAQAHATLASIGSRPEAAQPASDPGSSAALAAVESAPDVADGDEF